MNPGQTHVGLCSGWVWEPHHESDLPPYVDPGFLLLSVKQKRQSEVWETQTCLFSICGQSRLLQLRPEVKHTWTNITRLMERRCSDVTLTPAGHVSAKVLQILHQHQQMSDWFLSQMHSAQIRTSRANPKTENEDPQHLLQVLKASEIVTHLRAGGLTPFFALYCTLYEGNK